MNVVSLMIDYSNGVPPGSQAENEVKAGDHILAKLLDGAS
jgi:hypothetical protein